MFVHSTKQPFGQFHNVFIPVMATTVLCPMSDMWPVYSLVSKNEVFCLSLQS